MIRRCSHYPKMCRSIVVHNITWMLTKFGDMLLDEPIYEHQNLAPESDVKVVPQQLSGDICSNEGTFQCPGYLHGQGHEHQLRLWIHASKYQRLEEIPVRLEGQILQIQSTCCSKLYDLVRPACDYDFTTS